MQPPATSVSEKVLVLEERAADWQEAEAVLRKDVPDLTFEPVSSLQTLIMRVQEAATEIIVLDYNLSIDGYRDLIYELKGQDHEPSLVVVSEHNDPYIVNELYKHGCQRVILKDERWLEELSLALRHLMRFRHLKQENIRIRTKLTEANLMLEERNRRLNEFSATLAHDIRGPIGSVSMKLEYLLDHHNAPLDERTEEVLRRALSSCRRLTETVQAMYDFAKLGAKATEKQILDLNLLVRDVIADQHFNEALDIEIALGELPEIWGNAGLLRRAFSNLIENAVKYNDKKKIFVRICAGQVVQRPMGNFVEIVVEDNGPGIAGADLGDLFSMFRRGKGVSAEKEGSGLGLAVVDRIVGLHFGEVKVDTQAGEGTRFVLYLPTEAIALD